MLYLRQFTRMCDVFYNSITIRFMARAISGYHGDSVICVKISGNEECDSKVLLECSYFIFSNV